MAHYTSMQTAADRFFVHLQTLQEQIPMIAEAGFTAIWLPPPSDAVSAQGYLPRDYYNLDSKYGTEAELRELISVMHENGLKAIADIVINHRCAHFQVPASCLMLRTLIRSSVQLRPSPCSARHGTPQNCTSYAE